ncbi:MAG TPA: cupredoxin family copper-binding protein [Tepidisphaeraceae bacterium]|nr:cupredoxin family copper-binding protein [Tepidisphaeraceae bacterium]
MQRFRIMWLYMAWALLLMIGAISATAWVRASGGGAARAADAVAPDPDLTPAPPAPPATRPSAGFKVSIDNFTFQPKEISVPAGATVTWVNHDDVPHTATSTGQPRAFDSRALDTDDKYSFTFKRPGVYHYFCKVHTHMTGTVIVK